MRIEFDTGNATELLAVATLIEVLRGDLPATLADQVVPPAPALPAAEPQPDPAAAFAGGVSAEQAFAPPPPVAPTADAPTSAAPPPPPAAPATPPAGVEVDKNGLPWDKRIHSTPATKNADGSWRRKRGLDETVEATVIAELRQVMAAPGAPAAPLPESGGASETPAPDAAASTTAPPAPPPTPAAVGTASGPDDANNASSAPPPPPVPAAPPAPPAAPAHDPLAAAVADGWVVHPTADGYYYRGQEVVTTDDVAARYPATGAGAPPTPPAAPGGAAPATSFADLMRKITGMQTAGTLSVERTTEISQELGITGVRDLMHRPDLIPQFDAKLPVAA